MIDLIDAAAGYRSFQLKPTTFSFPPGQFTALIGPNGCGKSTLLRLIARQLRPICGQVRIAGKDMAEFAPKGLARLIGLLSQENPAPVGITVADLVGYGRAPHQNLLGIATENDREIVRTVLRRMELDTLADLPVSSLSGGQRQRTFLAMLLAQDASVMLFDEPTNWLDIQHQVQVLSLLRELAREGRTCIAVLHDIAQAARYADQVVVMKGGDITAAGPPESVVTSEIILKTYDLDVEIHLDPVAGTPVPYPVVKL